MKYFSTNHDREDDGHEGGLEDPQDGQTGDLDQREEVDPSEGDVAEIGKVRLVLRGHQIELDPIPELSRRQNMRVWAGLKPVKVP